MANKLGNNPVCRLGAPIKPVFCTIFETTIAILVFVGGWHLPDSENPEDIGGHQTISGAVAVVQREAHILVVIDKLQNKILIFTARRNCQPVMSW